MIGFRVHFHHCFSDELAGRAMIPLIDQCDTTKFEMEQSVQIPAAPKFFYTVSPDPFFEGRAP